MANAKPIDGFGEVDLEIEGGSVAPLSGFGEIDLPSPESSDPMPPPASSARVSVHDDSTRVVQGDALSALTRSSAPPPMEVEVSGGATRMASVDENLLEAARTGAEPPSVPSASVPSKSGVATRDDVAKMRELYAKGDTTGALMVAASLVPDAPEIRFGDHQDASISVDFGPEIEIDVSLSGLEDAPPPSNRFDARMEVDDEPMPPSQRSRPLTNPPPITAPPPSADPAAGLTLTQRQSIPRIVKTPAEIAALPIDHRGGFLLGFVDGMQTLEEILDICAMPGPEALDLVVQLAQLGVIEFD